MTGVQTCALPIYWKLFIPETGFITLPNLYFNEPGVYKIQLKNLKKIGRASCRERV